MVYIIIKGNVKVLIRESSSSAAAAKILGIMKAKKAFLKVKSKFSKKGKDGKSVMGGFRAKLAAKRAAKLGK